MKGLYSGVLCDLKDHLGCYVHPVKRSCGHVDALHYGDPRRGSAQEVYRQRRLLHERTRCADCEGMADQGFVVLDNHPAFAG